MTRLGLVGKTVVFEGFEIQILCLFKIFELLILIWIDVSYRCGPDHHHF